MGLRRQYARTSRQVYFLVKPTVVHLQLLGVHMVAQGIGVHTIILIITR